MTTALAVGILFAGGVFLVLRRGMIRIVVGFILLGHGVNVLLISAGGTGRRNAPLGEPDPGSTADPLPQAFVLTAIVITFGVTVYLLGLAAAREPADKDPADGDEYPADRDEAPVDEGEPAVDGPEAAARNPVDGEPP